MEQTRKEELEDLCWLVANMPPEMVSIANQQGIGWAKAIRDRARRILEREKDEEAK